MVKSILSEIVMAVIEPYPYREFEGFAQLTFNGTEHGLVPSGTIGKLRGIGWQRRFGWLVVMVALAGIYL